MPRSSGNQKEFDVETNVETHINLSILNSFEDASAYRQAWNDLVIRSGADIYQTYEWCYAWWKSYGSGRQLNLILLFSGDDLLGLVPAFVETIKLGLVKVKAAKLIGADYSLQLCNLPILPSILDTAVRRTIRYFLGEARCDLFLLGPLSGPNARIEEIVIAAENEHEFVRQPECFGKSVTTRFDLPEDFSVYLKTIGSSQRGNFNRRSRMLSKNGQIKIDTVSLAAEVRIEFEKFTTIHEKQWQSEGKLGHFGDWPHAGDFNHELVQELGSQGMVRFYRILVNDEVISSYYCFRHGRTNYWRLPARVCAPEWENLSLGKLGLVRMVESSIAEGISVIEGGRGHYDYKVQLGGTEWPLRTVHCMRRGYWAMIRVLLFRFSARVVNLIYYKILFCRLAPKFPPLRQPLWHVWIRSTF